MKFIKADIFTKLLPVATVWLAAIYPIVFLYAHNADQLLLRQLLFATIISLAFSSFVYLLWLFILKNGLRASLVTVVFLIFFWNYGLFCTTIAKIVSLKHWHFLPLFLFLYFHLVYFITRIRQQKTLNNLNTIFAIPILLLIVVNLITILSVEYKKNISVNSDYQNLNKSKGAIIDKNYPDIYFILLDEYASINAIKNDYGYDNSAFKHFLTEKGFYFANESRVRVATTTISMPTMLNLEYVDEKLSFDELSMKYNNNYLFNYLDKTGYKGFVLDGFSRSQHELKQQNFLHIYYDDVDIRHGFIQDEFSNLVIHQSMLNALFIFLEDDNIKAAYNTNNYFFNYISTFPKKANEYSQPMFLLAHVKCPHLPYVYDRDGNFSENPTNYFEYADIDTLTLRKLYLDQYVYVTKIASKVINEILSTSKNKPVILLLSDHGPRLGSAGIRNG